MSSSCEHVSDLTSLSFTNLKSHIKSLQLYWLASYGSVDDGMPLGSRPAIRSIDDYEAFLATLTFYSEEEKNRRWQAVVTAKIELSRRLWLNTNNPVFVWRSIHDASVAQLKLPDWCLTYLAEAAAEISKLSETAYRKYERRAKAGKERDSVPTLSRELSSILKFPAQGKSALIAYSSTLLDLEIKEMFDSLQQRDKLKKTDATGEVMRIYSIGDDRDVREVRNRAEAAMGERVLSPGPAIPSALKPGTRRRSEPRQGKPRGKLPRS